jgi:hypothetical protein
VYCDPSQTGGRLGRFLSRANPGQKYETLTEKITKGLGAWMKPVYQVRGPEFKCQYHQKIKIQNKNENPCIL